MDLTWKRGHISVFFQPSNRSHSQGTWRGRSGLFDMVSGSLPGRATWQPGCSISTVCQNRWFFGQSELHWRVPHLPEEGNILQIALETWWSHLYYVKCYNASSKGQGPLILGLPQHHRLPWIEDRKLAASCLKGKGLGCLGELQLLHALRAFVHLASRILMWKCCLIPWLGNY